MSTVADAPSTAVDVATALGLLTEGRLNSGFFSDPVASVRRVVSEPQQRDALLRAVAGLLGEGDGQPLLEPPGAGVVRSTHPFASGALGELLLVVDRAGAGDTRSITLSLAGAARSSAIQLHPHVTAELPLVRAVGETLTAVVGTPEAPLRVAAGLDIGWTRPERPIGLREARIDALLVAPPAAQQSRFTVTLGGLDLGDGVQDLSYDPLDPGEGAGRLIASLLSAGLALVEGPSEELRRVVEHLPEALGIAGDLPPLPFGELTSDPLAMRRWLADLADRTVDGGNALAAWLAEVAALLGDGSLGAAAAPTEDDPIVITLVAPTAGLPGIELTVGVRRTAPDETPTLLVGLRIEAAEPTVAARLRAEATLLALPLIGTAPATMLESAQAVIRTGDLLAPTPEGMAVGTLTAGLCYDGTRVAPILEVHDVTAPVGENGASEHFDRLDLIDASQLTAAGSALLETALRNGIASAAGDTVADAVADAVLDLVGLRAGAAHRVDIATLATAPTRALADYHRALLGDSQHAETLVRALWRLCAGAAPALPDVRGSGTADDPWALPFLGAPDATGLALDLAVWSEQSAGRPRAVRVALLARHATPDGAPPRWTVDARVLMFGVELPETGPGNPTMLSGVTASAAAGDLGELPAVGPVQIGASGLSLQAAWSAGTRLRLSLGIDDVTVAAEGETLALGRLELPPSGPLDLSALGASATAALRRILQRGLVSWAGAAGRVLAPLLEVEGDLAALLRDPAGALGAVVARLAREGREALPDLLAGLQALLSGVLPDAADLSLPDSALPVTGSGTPADPWVLGLDPDAAEGTAGLVWLEPDGPPASWGAPVLELLGTQALSSQALVDALGLLGAALPETVAALRSLDRTALADGLDALSVAIDGGDGVVPISAATPAGAAWTVADPVIAAHHRLPRAPAAIAAVRAEVGTMTAAGDAVVLYLAAPFGAAADWDDLLAPVAAAERASLSLRGPGDPLAVDLSGVPAAGHYAIELNDRGSTRLNDLVKQLDRVVGRIRTVGRPAARMVLVAHSASGLVAEAYAAAHVDNVLGVVALGTPFEAVEVPYAEGAAADALMAVRGLPLPAAADAAVERLREVLAHLAEHAATTGYAAALARTGGDRDDLGGIRAVAIAGQLEAPLTSTVARQLAAVARERGEAATAPTHLAAGARIALDVGAEAAGDPEVHADVRVDLGRLALNAGAAVEPAPPRAAVRIAVVEPGGWLVGGPLRGAGPLDAAVRWMKLAGTIVPGAVDVDAILHDGRISGLDQGTIGLDHVQGPVLLDAATRVLAQRAPAEAGRLRALLAALRALGLLNDDEASVLADRVRQLRTDPAAYLTERLPGLLDAETGLAGLVKVAAAQAAGRGPWRLPLDPVPLELLLAPDPWRVTLRTAPAPPAAAAEPVAVADGVAVAMDATVALGTLAGTVAARLEVGDAVLAWDGAARRLTLTAEPLLAEPLVLVPVPGLGAADPAAVEAALRDALGAILPATALGAALEALTGGVLPVDGLLALVRDPGAVLAGALGPGDLPTPEATNALLALLARGAGGPTSDSAPLTLPGGIVVRAVAAGDGLGLRLAGPPSGPVSVAAGVDLDAALHVRPAGNVTLAVALPGEWGTLEVAFRIGDAVSLTVRPTGLGTTVTLLPRPADFDRLAGAAAERLLPRVLDLLVQALQDAAPPVAAAPRLLDDALVVAQALGVYDPSAPEGQRFGAVAERLRDLADEDLTTLAPQVVPAVVTLVDRLLPAGVSASASGARVTVSAAGVAQGAVEVSADLGVHPPAIAVAATGLRLGPVTAGAGASYAAPAIAVGVDVGLDIDTTLGFRLVPALHAERDGAGNLVVALRPLGPADPWVVALAPTPTPPTPADLGRLVPAWVAPLIAHVMLDVAGDLLTRPLWQPAPSVSARDLLQAARVLDAEGRLNLALAGPTAIVRGLLDALTAVELPVADDLALRLLSDGSRIGLVLVGSVRLPLDALEARIELQPPGDIGWPAGERGVGMLLFDTGGGGLTVRPALQIGGAGLDLAGPAGGPLVNSALIHVGSVAARARARVELLGGVALPQAPQLAVQVDDLGVPFASGEGGNPIAAGLLNSGPSGDGAPVNPPLGLVVAGTPGGLLVRLNGRDSAEPVYVPVHRTFGPLHIEQIGFSHRRDAVRGSIVGVAVDGGVSAAGLSVDVQDLTIGVPLRTPLDLGTWELDLAGLSVSLVVPSLSIAGGLFKTSRAGVLTYDGILSVSVVGRSFTALGSYARPTDAQGSYTSMFVFVSLPFPLGGPPYLFVLGLAGGAGYNRRLLVPSDPAGVPGFPLVKGMDPDFARDPVAALTRMGTDMPPARGSYWVAGGLRFTTFALLRTTAVAYVALDRGFEVGLLGLMQLALPAEGAALVNVELALAARYSTVDQTLSIRAALTNNSYLFTRDCRLTGGFALVVWFSRPEALLTIGGYHPAFVVPAHYPAVDRVGFNWSVGGGIVVKGGSYFAITHSAVMFGGRLEASYDRSPVRAWFAAGIDVLITWDPFTYDLRAYVSIGVGFRFRICLFFCVTIDISLSLGADVHIVGPPLHGTVTIDIAIGSVTVAFGREERQNFLTWPQVRDKYVLANGSPSATTATDGAAPDGGAAGGPVRLQPEFTLRCESKMPSLGAQLPGRGLDVGVGLAGHIDVVPMNGQAPMHPTLTVTIRRPDGTPVDHGPFIAGARAAGFPAAQWQAGFEGMPDAPMVRAVSGIDITVPLSFREPSGQLGGGAVIPFSSLVDEGVSRPLPLLQAPGVAPAIAPEPREEPQPVADDGAGRVPPLLRAVVAVALPLDGPAPAKLMTHVTDGDAPRWSPPRGGDGVRVVGLRAAATDVVARRALGAPERAHGAGAASAGAARRVAAEAADGGAALQPGVTHVWDVPDGAELSLAGPDAVRLVALSGGGAVLTDVEGVAGALSTALPDGTTRVVITSLGAAGNADGAPGPAAITRAMSAGDVAATGWDAASQLLAVGRGVLLGRGCTVRSPAPLPVPARGPRERYETAAHLAARFGELVTELRYTPEVLAVIADRRAPSVPGLGDLVVDIEGAGVIEPTMAVNHEHRTTLLHRLARAGDGPARVTVASAGDWVPAGVVGLPGPIEGWRAELAADPHRRLVDDRPWAGGLQAPTVRLRPREEAIA